MNSQSSGGRSIRNPAAARTPDRVGHAVLGDDQIDVVLRLRRSVHPQRVAAAEREGHLVGLQRRGGPLQRVTEGRVLFVSPSLGSDGRYLLPMRLATFNILHGRGLSDGVVDLDRLADAVRSLDADILALQEVDRDQPRSHLADLTAVAAEAMGAVTHRFAAALSGHARERPGSPPPSAMCPAPASYGIALLSRYPALSWQVLHLPRIPVRFPFYLPTPRKVVVVHEEPRAVVIGHLDTPAGPVVVANTHLSFVPGWGQSAAAPDPTRPGGGRGPGAADGRSQHGRATCPSRITGYRSLARHPTFPLDHPDRQLDHILLRGRLGQVTSSAARPHCRCPITGRSSSTSILTAFPDGKADTLITTDHYIRFERVDSVAETAPVCWPTCTANSCEIDIVSHDVVRIKISRGGVFDESPTYAVCVDPLADPAPFPSSDR